jgi:hypothetical protein
MERQKTPAWWWAFAAAGVTFWLVVLLVSWHFIAKWW